MVQVGKLRVNLERREVTENGLPLRIGSRAFDVLEFLIDASGSLVLKDEIISHVWPDTVVEENNLQVQIAVLRKALGEDRGMIRTIPGRGYQLVGLEPVSVGPSGSATRDQLHNIPAQGELIGRETDVADIGALLGESPVLTLVGAGGIGKTSLAIRAAREYGHRFADGVRYVELAPVGEPGEVVSAAAEACGVRFADGAASAVSLAQRLARQKCLVILDNAEHVVAAVAELADALAAYYPAVTVLATSREPLRIASESIYRVEPLAVASDDAPLEYLNTCPSVQLFMRRAQSLGRGVGTDERNVRLVGVICQRLDGIPLAIELAAARSAALGVAGVYAHLDDRLQLLAGGKRNALPRHQTLRATFDWSYALLDTSSRKLFRRLGVFAARFTFEAACAVAMDDVMTMAAVISGIGELTAKSLLNVEFEDDVARYRLSESTRAYALEKLQDEGEVQRTAERHARFIQQSFEECPLDGCKAGAPSRQIDLRHALDDARDSFDWAFSPVGNSRLGVALAGALVGPLLECSLVDECCARAGRAVDAIDALPPDSVDPACEMHLCATLASTLANTKGPVSSSAQLWQRVLALASRTGDLDYQAKAIWGLWNTMISLADMNTAMGYAMRYRQFATEHGTQWQRILGDQLVAVTLHCFGMHEQARVNLEQGIQHLEALQHEVPRGGLSVDPLIFSHGTLARIAWIQGDPDRAMKMVEQTVNLVRTETLEPSLSHVLAAVAVPLALMTGDLHSVDRYLDVLRSQVALHRMDMWCKYCDCLSAQRDELAGDGSRSLPSFEAALDALLARGFRRVLTLFVGECAASLARCGRAADAKRRLADALAWCDGHGEQLFVPEIWRVMGIVEFEEATRCATTEEAVSHEARARGHFETAIRIAGEHRASMWALRATLALARLLVRQGLRAQARSHLQPFAAIFDPRSRARDIRNLYDLLSELCTPAEVHHGFAGELEATGAVASSQPPPNAL
ncbi:ATP-binding protein [Paraburkholderia oxyphila]|uniref:ATP-binding protein n=1 Tax=Paraburkholderia oxyphila TaxID=614212 RepID=UPI000AD008CC|nr:winged helix-turn-helix domain-containing protein [Paraburkholderia oxyphila]